MPPRKKNSPRPSHLATQLLHAGELTDETFRPVATPIYRATTYGLTDEIYRLVKKVNRTEDPAGEVNDADVQALRDQVFYARDSNPNVAVVERKMAALEGCQAAVAAASGMGAIAATLLSLVRGKKYIVSTPHLYGAAHTFIYHELAAMFGLRVIDLADFLGCEKGVGRVFPRPNGRSKSRGIKTLRREKTLPTPFFRPDDLAAIYVESLSNPFLLLAPLGDLVAVRDAVCPDVPIVVDNTFLTPANFRPFTVLDPRRDVVVYSATKYLGGHADVIAGLACGSTAAINKVWDKMTLYGACLDAETAYYLERGLKTLDVRMERHNRNLAAVFDYLAGVAERFDLSLFHPLAGKKGSGVVCAKHPKGLQANDSRPLFPEVPAWARELVRDGRLGGMITFNLNGKTERDGIRFMEALDRTGVIKHATSLGGVESLIAMPYNMMQPTPLQQAALDFSRFPCLLRLSVGLEDPADLIAALDLAFRATRRRGI